MMWQPMDTAPRNATVVLGVDRDGEEFEMHFARNLSGEEQPPFEGWFAKYQGVQGYWGVDPVKWKPLAKGWA